MTASIKSNALTARVVSCLALRLALMRNVALLFFYLPSLSARAAGTRDAIATARLNHDGKDQITRLAEASKTLRRFAMLCKQDAKVTVRPASERAKTDAITVSVSAVRHEGVQDLARDAHRIRTSRHPRLDATGRRIIAFLKLLPHQQL